MPCVSGSFAFPRHWVQCLNSPYSGRGWTTANGLYSRRRGLVQSRCQNQGLSQRSRCPRSRHFLTSYITNRARDCWQMLSFSCFDFPTEPGSVCVGQILSRRASRHNCELHALCALATITIQIQSVLCIRARARPDRGGELQGAHRDQHGALTIGRSYASLVSSAPAYHQEQK